ncbi:MAG: efflux transporter outer membrane subunit, partial [Parachlamydiaceae bacterium]|nr:efflux transporter outer membrane subunit [Parachlamydiaceae bacterium]
MQRQTSSLAISLFKNFIFFTTLTACTVGPKYIPPEMNIPCEWHNPIPQGMCENNLEQFVWWESLNDPVLNSLIERAASQNLDISIAASRVSQARRIYAGKKADLLPHIDGSVNYDHAYYNQKTLNNILGTKKCERHSSKKNIDIFEIGFDADWEIDLFGKTAHEISAFKAEFESAQESLNDAWVILSAEVGRNYIELRGYQQQLLLVSKNINAQKETVALTSDLVAAGLANDVSQNQSQEQLSLLEIKKPLLEFAVNKAIYRLSVLLAHPPTELYEELICVCGALPSLPTDRPIGIPSELLRRRPDIRKAERELAAATEHIGSAIANLFPRFSLRGFIGDISTHLPSLLSSGSNTWIAGPQLLLPIFNSRLIEQDIQFNKFKAEQVLFEYQKVVLGALEETENALGAFNAEVLRNKHLVDVVKTSQMTYDLVNDLYQNGFKDYFEVVVSQNSLVSNEEAFIQSNIDLLIHYIS